MIKQLKYILIVIGVCTGQYSQAAMHIGIREGLSQSSVNDILQDRNGFLWVATDDGLNRYDGYEFTVFYHDAQDSLSLIGNVVNALMEDRSGNIWVGTDLGISIVDPHTNDFHHFNSGLDVLNNQVISYFKEDNLGRIWIGTASNGLGMYDPSKDYFKHFLHNPSNENTLTGNDISILYQDKEDGLWVGTANHGLNYLAAGQQDFRRINPSTFDKNSIISSNIIGLLEDWEGNLWVNTNKGVSILAPNQRDGKRFRFVNIWPEDWVGLHWTNLFQTSKGEFVMGFSNGRSSKAELTPSDLKNGSFKLIHVDEGMAQQQYSELQCIFEDATGILWLGTDAGLIKVDGNKNSFDHIKSPIVPGKFKNSNNVNAILKTFDGAVYTGTPAGLSRFTADSKAPQHYNLAKWTNRTQPIEVNSIFQAYTGRIWLGTTKGAYELLLDEQNEPIKVKQIQYCSADDELALMVRAILVDNQGYLWIGSENGLFRMNQVTQKTAIFRNRSNDKQSISDNRITSIYQDGKGIIWVGTEIGLNHILYNTVDSLEFKRFKHSLNTNTGPSNNFITSIVEDKHGELWLGTYGGGANKVDYSSQRFSYYNDKKGLQNNVVHGILIDEQNNKWMSTNKGLSVWLSGKEMFKHFEVSDGLQSNEFNPGAYHLSEAGELFFGGINGFNVINPREIKGSPTAPKVAITRFDILNQQNSLHQVRLRQPHGEDPLPLMAVTKADFNLTRASEVILKHRQNNFIISYVGLHFASPASNTYEYRLKGHDDDWVKAGGHREARYSNLSYGDYTFMVRSANPDGVWSEPLALKVTVTPPFWQTWWFRLTMIGALLLIGYAVYRTRVGLIREQKEMLEYQVKERTAEVLKQNEEIEAQKSLLEAEKEKAESLLLNMLPQETVDELKIRGKASARHYESASVMFTDFKSFTQIAENLKPQELVAELDRYFIKYDEIIEKHGIEKIKTIGDSYMCAGGIPVRNKTNAIDVVLAAMEIQRYMKELKEIRSSRNEKYWEVRIGIHTGELIAGVIGIKRFAYDIWGDTVNVANRMELSGVPGKVNISGRSYEEIKPFFDCTFRGKVLAKNKGEIDMYFVDRIKPHLSINGEGRDPNDMFWEYVNLRMYSSINYRRAEKYIIRKLRRNLSEDLSYHGVHHTLDVCHSAEAIAQSEGIKGEDLFLLKTAALYHDAGFVTKYMDNEEVGAEMARKELIQFGYTPDQIETVCRLILATKVPQKPTSHLEEIICDADLDYLGREDFFPISESLKREFMLHGIIKSNQHWDEVQVKFLSNHTYFTTTAQTMRQEKKMKHLEQVKKRLNQY